MNGPADSTSFLLPLNVVGIVNRFAVGPDDRPNRFIVVRVPELGVISALVQNKGETIVGHEDVAVVENSHAPVG